MQLERMLQSQGFGTRRQCRELIESGEVAVAGQPCDDPQAEFATEGLAFSVGGEAWTFREYAYLMLHKPAGYECSQKPAHHPSIYSLLPAPLLSRGVQCVGRLDADTTGLILLSDDGQFIHRMSSPKHKVPKVYAVGTSATVDEAQVAALCAGVRLHDEPAPVAARACRKTADKALLLTLTEGKYHQVKRMVAAAGNNVAALARVAVGGLELPADLPAGQWRWLDAALLSRLTASNP